MTPPRKNQGLAKLIDGYDLFLFDQWGVIHDGHTPYPGILKALTNLRALPDKTLLVLSNSARPSAHSINLMASMGIAPNIFDEVITSGEHCLKCLAERPHGFYANLGRNYYSIHWPEGYHLPENPGYQPVSAIADADFILLTGVSQPIADYQPLLRQALTASLPIVCANPDLYSPQPGGHTADCPGQIADLYDQMGGVVMSHGKPAPALYHTILDQYRVPRERTLAIGDSLQHDIRGANGVGIASLFLTQGVHRSAWQALVRTVDDVTAASRLGEQYGVRIDYFAHAVEW